MGAAFDRYEKASNFKVQSSMKRHKTGNHSVVRTTVTGVRGQRAVYQTMPCDLPQDTMLSYMQCLDYDLSSVCIKRDPSHQAYTRVFVLVNTDANVKVIVTNDVIAKPLNRDQDGDRNTARIRFAQIR